MQTAKHSLSTTVIGSDDGKKTFEIKREWGSGKKAIFIELYPTTNTESADHIDTSTVCLLNKASSDLGLGSIRILNLYATVFFSEKPTTNLLYEDTDNLAYIESVLDEEGISDYDIVVAWGNTLGTHDCTKRLKTQILNLLLSKGLEENVKQLTADNLDTQANPGVHPLYLGLRFSKDSWGLSTFPIESELSKLSPKINAVPSKPEKTVDSKKVGKKKNKGEKDVSTNKKSI